MPLIPGNDPKVISHNISEMIKAGHPKDQAIAASLENSRNRPEKKKSGGKLGVMRPVKMHEPHGHDSHTPHFGGLFGGNTGGRLDNQKVAVPKDSYIIPADVVSNGLGQGNTLSGAKVLDHLVNGGPSGGKAPAALKPIKLPGGGPLSGYAKGGMIHASGGLVPIIVASGEYHIHPDAVKRIGGGSIAAGHSILDAFVNHIRKKSVKEVKALPGPKT